eukprot:6200782-Pleurochrysis_carterae.AAC.2
MQDILTRCIAQTPVFSLPYSLNLTFSSCASDDCGSDCSQERYKFSHSDACATTYCKCFEHNTYERASTQHFSPTRVLGLTACQIAPEIAYAQVPRTPNCAGTRLALMNAYESDSAAESAVQLCGWRVVLEILHLESAGARSERDGWGVGGRCV